MAKTMRGLASEIAKREGKKSQAKIGDIREILGILSDILYADYEQYSHDTAIVIIESGKKRSKRKKK